MKQIRQDKRRTIEFADLKSKQMREWWEAKRNGTIQPKPH